METHAPDTLMLIKTENNAIINAAAVKKFVFNANQAVILILQAIVWNYQRIVYKLIRMENAQNVQENMF